MRDAALIIAFIVHLASWIGVIVFSITRRYDLAALCLSSAIYFRLVQWDVQK